MVTAEDVTAYLLRVGIPTSILGFGYLRTALMLVLEDENCVHGITKYIYPEVARRHNTEPSRAERAIRTAVEAAWLRGDYDFQQEIFGYSISPRKEKPTNGEFIGRSADFLKRQTTTFNSVPDSLKKEFLQLWDMFCKQREGVRV